MPIPRKPPEISNYQFLCALLYMIENGCKWRALPKKYGKWRLQMEGTAKEIWKVAHNLYEIQQVVKKWDNTENL